MSPWRHLPRRARSLAAVLGLLLLTCGCAPSRAATARGPRRDAALAALARGGVLQGDDVTAGPLAPATGQPRGWILLIHGGAWTAVGPTVTQAALTTVAPLRSEGWSVDDVDYRPGLESLPDVLTAYRHLRAQLATGTPLCVLGESAGAQLALLLAALQPRLRCVITEGAPTDFQTIARQPAWAPAGESPETGPAYTLSHLIEPVFGSDPATLARWSPVTYASEIRARILMGGSSFDPVIPEAAQMGEMAAADPDRVQTVLLAGEPTPAGSTLNFIHASITPAAQTQWLEAETAQLDWLAGSAAPVS